MLVNSVNRKQFICEENEKRLNGAQRPEVKLYYHGILVKLKP